MVVLHPFRVQTDARLGSITGMSNVSSANDERKRSLQRDRMCEVRHLVELENATTRT